MAAAGHATGVVRVLERAEPSTDPDVVAAMVHGHPDAVTAPRAALDRLRRRVVQHEFGIYGGPDGDEVLEVLEQLTVPSIVVLHTVLVDPTPHQRDGAGAVVARAPSAVVTMTTTARDRLLRRLRRRRRPRSS